MNIETIIILIVAGCALSFFGVFIIRSIISLHLYRNAKKERAEYYSMICESENPLDKITFVNEMVNISIEDHANAYRYSMDPLELYSLGFQNYIRSRQ